MSERELRRDTRSVSEILGYTLVFSLVVVTVAVISVGGLSSYQEAQNFERQTNAQKAFDVMHNNFEDIYFKGAPSRATEVDLGETELALGDPITINITVAGQTDMNITTRPLVQNLGDENELVYEAGAVFQTTRDGGVVRRGPPMLLRSDTVHVIAPNLTTTGRSGVGGGVVLVRARSLNQSLVYENASASNDITINVSSPRSDLWQEVFVERGAFDEGDCDLSADNDWVSCDVTVDRVYLVRSDIGVFFDR